MLKIPEVGKDYYNEVMGTRATVVAVHNGNVYYEYNGPPTSCYGMPMGRSIEAFWSWYEKE